LATLRARLVDSAPKGGPQLIQPLTGPCQVGKTTLLLALAADFGDHALYVAGDAPESSLAGCWEQL